MCRPERRCLSADRLRKGSADVGAARQMKKFIMALTFGADAWRLELEVGFGVPTVEQSYQDRVHHACRQAMERTMMSFSTS